MPLDNDKLKGFQLIRNLGGPIHTDSGIFPFNRRRVKFSGRDI